MRTVTKLVAAVGLALVPALLVAPASHATGNHDQVCVGLDSGKTDVQGNKKSVTLTAPAGKLIDRYCVKAGSTKHGGGPKYFDVEPPKASITVTHPSGKDISHYSYSVVTDAEPCVPVSTKTGKPKHPKPSPTPTRTPTATAPTTAPTTAPPCPPTSEPTTPPTDEPTTPPTTEPTDEPTTEPTEPTTPPTSDVPSEPTTPTESVAPTSETATPPADDSGDDDKGVGGSSDENAPTAVDAGLVGNSTSTTSIATLVGLTGGALLLASAFMMRMRKRGDHRA
ncbi:hypothetical protein [Mumia zhuanghuii]|uniref:LPXTG cell wall anchor domain-containing protein n=1 Tax=Mumia zhuanghuii TaxID=2585211 RepID=A0A5C4MJ82_9ACTN|nr:hypothetical protein [Mumia zhuanghuii]TNC41300.1 hypothetical protein FHE65_22450 [Mumia zhuanghuii]TNC50917.1 hypothetical protein FHE65_02780 [Mumia zhuanghuii]